MDPDSSDHSKTDNHMGISEEVREFNNSYDISADDIDTYKQRMVFRKWSARAGIISILLLGFSLYWIGSTPPDSLLVAAGILLLVILSALFIILDLYFDFRLWRDEIDSELIVCYELACAFRDFTEKEEPDMEAIEHHLSESLDYMKLPGMLSAVDPQRIAYSHREGINKYIQKYLNAAEKERELTNTFPQFMQYTSEIISLKNGSRIKTLSQKIDRDQTQKPSIRDGLRREVLQAKEALITESVGVVIVGLVIAGITYPYIGVGGGFGLGAFVITAYGILQRS